MDEKATNNNPLLVVYDEREGNNVSTIVDFNGVVERVSFPYSALEQYGFKRGDRFEWTKVEGRDVLPSDIKPWKKEYTEEEEAELKRRHGEFVADLKPLSEILAGWHD